MKIRWAIVLTSECAAEDYSLIETRLKTLLAMEVTPVLVLGRNGDEVLRHATRLMDNCEFVYNPNDDRNFFANVKTGLLAVDGPAYLYPLHEALPEPETWRRLESECGRIPGENPVDVVRPVSGPRRLFPQLITLHGLKHLKRFKSVTDWDSDPDMCFVDIPLVTAS